MGSESLVGVELRRSSWDNAWRTQMSQIGRWDGGGRVDRKQNVPAEQLSGDICNVGVALDFWSFLGLEV